jgi:hypothetical protein
VAQPREERKGEACPAKPLGEDGLLMRRPIFNRLLVQIRDQPFPPRYRFCDFRVPMKTVSRLVRTKDSACAGRDGSDGFEG